MLRLRYDASLITDKQVYVKEQHMGAVEQTSETDDLLSEDVIDSQVSSRERDTAEAFLSDLALYDGSYSPGFIGNPCF